MTRRIAATSLVVSLCLSTIGIATEQGSRDSTDSVQAKKLSVEQLIAKLDGPQESFIGLSGNETFVELYLGIYRIYYTAENEDEPVLLAAMLDQNRPLERRLCLAALLLDLNNDEARRLVEECSSGKHGPEAKQDATFALVNEDLNWRQKQIVRLLEIGARDEHYDAAWDALCRRAGELKLEEAVDPLIAILRRRPTDGEAALALGEIGDRRAIPVLLKTIEHDGGVQPYHMYALQELEAPGLAAILIRHLDEVSLNIASSQSPFGVGPECVDVLGNLDAKEAIEPLKKLLATSNDETLNSSIRLALTRLTSVDTKDLAERLMRIAETADTSSERWSALDHVGPTGQRWTVPRLLKIAKTNTDSSVIHGAITEIGELGGDEAVAGLITLFDHDFSHVPRSEMRRKGEEWSDFDPIVAIALRTATGEDLGNDAQAWQRYLK